ncbi:bifunctional 4-hydroxy-2-oxoglutarate aldolase/2-dehydro-3-deoxy-phosphogluconate aldolase (plasmid) [Haloferacaceae archaeon DSL9]
MNSREQFDRIESAGVVAIVRGVERDVVVDVVEAILDGGVDCVEITADSPDVLSAIKTVDETFGEELLLGVGTVLDAETATMALSAGAEFLVTPTLDEDVIRVANRYDSVVTPGVQTPSEALTAFEAGAGMVKIFPAGPLGPDYVSSINGPLGHIPLMPTGGIGAENAKAFFDAGATAVGVGSAIVDGDAIADRDYDRIRQNAERFVETVPRC